MAHQCDLNNNYVNYTSAYANTNATFDRDSNSTLAAPNSKLTSSQFTAKLIVGSAINERREKEKSRLSLAHATERRN
uniref:Hypothetical conserved protein n=1 Tax=Glossina morsitans morsitans TaxID=37546 RepID=D3TP15_GLOMM